MQEEKIHLERRRHSDYVVNYTMGTNKIPYKWNAFVKGRSPHVLAVPREVFDYLNMSTDCIRNAELVVSEKQPNKAEVEIDIVEVDDISNNSHTHAEIVALLNGNFNKMKSELKKVTVPTEKRFIKSVTEEIKDELNGAKYKFVTEWFTGKSESEEE